MTEQAFIPARPDIGEDEIAAVAHAMRSGWSPPGPKPAPLNRNCRLPGRCGGGVIAADQPPPGCICVKAIGNGPGDEVIAPTLTSPPPPKSSAIRAPIRVLRIATRVTPQYRRDENQRHHAAHQGHRPHYGGLARDMDAIRHCAQGCLRGADRGRCRPTPCPPRTKALPSASCPATWRCSAFHANKTHDHGSEGGTVVTGDADLRRAHKIIWPYRHQPRCVRPFHRQDARLVLRNCGRLRCDNRIDMAARWSGCSSSAVCLCATAANSRRKLSAGGAARLAADPACRRARCDTHSPAHLFVLRFRRMPPCVAKDAVIQQLSDAGIGTQRALCAANRQPYWRVTVTACARTVSAGRQGPPAHVQHSVFTAMSRDADQERIAASVGQIRRRGRCGSSACSTAGHRLLDCCCWAPLLRRLAVWIRLDSLGPVFFPQEQESAVTVSHFQSCSNAADNAGPQITVCGRSHHARSGRFIRAYKLSINSRSFPQRCCWATWWYRWVPARGSAPCGAVSGHCAKDEVLSVRPGMTELGLPYNTLQRKRLRWRKALIRTHICGNHLPAKLRCARHARERPAAGPGKS